MEHDARILLQLFAIAAAAAAAAIRSALFCPAGALCGSSLSAQESTSRAPGLFPLLFSSLLLELGVTVLSHCQAVLLLR